MWTTLAMLTALSSSVAAETPSLKISRVRLTYGMHGPVRTDAKLLPGGSLDIAWNIEGLTAAASGEIEYSTMLEILNKDGKTLFKQDPKPEKALLALGGNQVPAVAHLDIGFESPAGEYTVRITVQDVVGKQSKTFSQRVQVMPPEFGIVRVTTTSDSEGRNPTAVPGAGEMLWINFLVANFARDAKEKQPHIAFEMRIFDDKGKPTTPKPYTGTVKGMVHERAVAVPGQFGISLNRPGKFRVELKATCEICKKSVELSFPLVVVAPQ